MATRQMVILFFILLEFIGIKAYAYDFSIQVDDYFLFFNYCNEGRDLEVSHNGANSYKGVIVIPEEVTYMNRKRKVVSIGKRAFYQCFDLTSVTIPNSVTSIEYGAFYQCGSLTSVNIPDNLISIGEDAFWGCAFNTLTIPNSVTTIGKNAFRGCAITSVTIPNTISEIVEGMFYGCYKLTSVTIPSSVTNIGKQAFTVCESLTSVTIPSSVTNIGMEAFYQCGSLTSVVIPDGVTTIGEAAFGGCINLYSVTIPNSVKKIESRAFYSDLQIVISLMEEPDAIYSVFTTNTLYNATLYVPIGTKDNYINNYGWNDFLFIEEGLPTTINKINKDDLREKKCFNLNGQIVSPHHKGIIIQMNNGINKKVLIK